LFFFGLPWWCIIKRSWKSFPCLSTYWIGNVWDKCLHIRISLRNSALVRQSEAWSIMDTHRKSIHWQLQCYIAASKAQTRAHYPQRVQTHYTATENLESPRSNALSQWRYGFWRWLDHSFL
jgi:hypothetical protein